MKITEQDINLVGTTTIIQDHGDIRLVQVVAEWIDRDSYIPIWGVNPHNWYIEKLNDDGSIFGRSCEYVSYGDATAAYNRAINA